VLGAAAPLPPGRNTRMRPALLSATNTSPLGATRMMRGSARPEANRLTSKPFGTIGFWSVRRTSLTKFRADADVFGAGKSCGLMIRRTPGWSARQSSNAAVPSSSPAPVWANSGMAARVKIAAAVAARISRTGCGMACSWRGSQDEQAQVGTVPPVTRLDR
jgi:hypothetical protein